MIALAKVAQMLGVPKKFIPVFNIVSGIILSVFYLNPLNIKTGILEGIIAGLSASGLYSGVKNTIQGVREQRSIL